MGRISEKNLRYRDKETIIKDVCNILRSDVAYGTKYAVVNEITWVWTEFYGKYSGCPYWSEEALNLYAKKNEITDYTDGKYLIHEHVVPKNVIIDELLGLKKIEEDDVKFILENTLIGTVITKKEDKLLLKSTMPKNISSKSLLNYSLEDIWARYRENNSIKINKVEWDKNKVNSINNIK